MTKENTPDLMTFGGHLEVFRLAKYRKHALIVISNCSKLILQI